MKRPAIIVVILIVGYLIYSATKGGDGHIVTVPDGTSKKDIFQIDVYAPYTRAGLLDDPESRYGEPSDTGSEGKKPHYVFYDEYIGKHGRIRIYDEAYPDEDGWQATKWIELHSTTLYLRDVVNPALLKGITESDEDWSFLFTPADKSWHVVVSGEGHIITKIYEK